MKKPTNEVKPKAKSKLIPIAIIIAVLVIFVPFLFYFPEPDVIIIIEPNPSDDPEETQEDTTDPNLDRDVYAIIKKTYTFSTDVPILSPSDEIFFNGADGNYDVNRTEIKIKDFVPSETTYTSTTAEDEYHTQNSTAVQVHIPVAVSVKNFQILAKGSENATFTVLNSTYNESEDRYYPDSILSSQEISVDSVDFAYCSNGTEFNLSAGVYFFAIQGDIDWASELSNATKYNRSLVYEESWQTINRSFSYTLNLEPLENSGDFLIVAKVRVFDGVFKEYYFQFQTNDTCVFTENIKGGAQRLYFEPLFWKDVSFTFDQVVMNCSRFYATSLQEHDDTKIKVVIPMNTLLGLTTDHSDFEILVRIPTDFEIYGVYYSNYGDVWNVDNAATYEREGEFIIIPYNPSMFTIETILLKREGE